MGDLLKHNDYSPIDECSGSDGDRAETAERPPHSGASVCPLPLCALDPFFVRFPGFGISVFHSGGLLVSRLDRVDGAVRSPHAAGRLEGTRRGPRSISAREGASHWGEEAPSLPGGGACCYDFDGPPRPLVFNPPETKRGDAITSGSHSRC